MPTVLKLLLSAAIPAVVFFGGVWLMGRLSHRDLVRARLPLIPVAGERKFLSQRLTYDLPALTRYYGALDRPALESERRFLELDLVFPLLYGAAFAGSLLYVWTVLGRPFSPVYVILPVAITVLADWTENLTQLRLLRDYMSDFPLDAALVRLAAVATGVKLLFFTASTLLLLGLIGWAVF